MNIKDYLHLYLSCEILIEPYEDQPAYIDTIEGICVGESVNFKKASDYYFDDLNDFDIKPLLRPLSNMTESEAMNVIKPMVYGLETLDGEELFRQAASLTNYLISKHFDAFGLIEAGLAIDKTKLDAK